MPAWRSLARRAYHSAPAGFWRSFDGLRADLRSLPARLADPARRREPWEVVHNVGGHHREAGLAGLAMLRTHGGLRPNDRVLDIGCGTGRMAGPLLEALGPDGSYVGFDVSRAAVRYCRRELGRLHPHAHFHHLDVRNGVYNPRGRVAEEAARFPCEDAAVTLAFATSVLTHLPLPSIRRYLRETRRVLAPGGRALVTVMALTPQVRAWAAEGRTASPLQPWGEGAMTVDPRWPENGLAYDEALLLDAAGAAGLRVEALLAGHWRPEPASVGGQDLMILRA